MESLNKNSFNDEKILNEGSKQLCLKYNFNVLYYKKNLQINTDDLWV